ncbi:nuclear transport factor 2 family protein [Streptomyces sp. YIM 98790]|uniref:YybH family protein n=1 Tax=Streptomyces sp. YIM 98790 TaxID=2689077 RepID=UPI0028BD9CE9|nr:nuclear transport factor 2 family protein [Streptomyces sp. YIM 98790]
MHRGWSEATARGDLDALMSGIADDVVSYEHDEPLQHLGADAVREVCRHGLDSAAGAVGWHIPDLRVLVRGDLAVAWGLNRMTAGLPGGGTAESWSRGTRVFRRRNGRWMLVHQHLSYPYDPATGRAGTGLRP